MNKLQSKRSERSLLLQRLQELRIEIKEQCQIDLTQKWEALQELPAQQIKIGGLGEQKSWYGSTFPKINPDIFQDKDREIFIQYQKDSRILVEQIDKLRCYYDSEQHKSIVQTIIESANNSNDIVVKRQLINNLSEPRKRHL